MTSQLLDGVPLRSRLWVGSGAPLALALGPCPRAVAQEHAVEALGVGITAVVGVRLAVAAIARSSPGELTADAMADLDQLARWIVAWRGQGAHALVELTHGGPRAGALQPTRPVGPAEVVDAVHGRTPRILTSQELEQIVERFVAAAQEVVRVGATLLGVEVADGALLHAYLSPLTNPEGGTLAERLEPTVRIVTRLRELAPVVVRLCAEERTPGGLTPTDGVEVAQRLAAAGAAALVIEGGGRAVRHLQRPVEPPGPLVEGTHARLAAWIKRAVTIPVGCLGGLRSRAALDALLDGSHFDFAVLERPFVCEPRLGEGLAWESGAARCTSQSDCLISTERVRCEPP